MYSSVRRITQATATCDDHSLERRLYYNVNGAPDTPALFTADSSVNRKYVHTATRRTCKTIRIFLLNLINESFA
jgi:hypothetical protein